MINPDCAALHPGYLLWSQVATASFSDSAPAASIQMMTKHDAIQQLGRRADAIKAMGATALYLFGSVAQDDARAASDLDLFIDYDRNGRFNAFDLVGIKQFLEQELGVEVDVTTRDGLHPALRADIERSAVRVF